jgi:hypothetical protein
MTAPAHPIAADAAHQIATPALSAMLQTRIDQIVTRGHTAEADDQTGAHALVAIARAKLLRALRTHLRESEQLLQAAQDMTMGGTARLDDHALDVLYRRIIAGGALCLAAADTIDRERARRISKGKDHAF